MNKMQLLNKAFRKLCVSTLDNKINTAEVIYRFNNIINLHSLIRNAESFRFKNTAGLIMSKLRAFNVIRVIGKVNLNFMIDTAFQRNICGHCVH